MSHRIIALFAILVAGCGGSSRSSSDGPPIDTQPADPDPPAVQSAGGIWHAAAAIESSMTLLIAENGMMRVMQAGPAFGAGAVIVNAPNEVEGAYDVRSIQSILSAPGAADRTCEFSGTVTERVSMQLRVSCTDVDGNRSEVVQNMVYDAAYNEDSSLDQIAGNYRLAFDTETNMISINGDGVIFGTFHNGAADCTVNGRVDIIDPRFALYDFEFQFSACVGFFDHFEGAALTGLGFEDPSGTIPGSFLMLITGVVGGRFEFFSVLYEPV